MRKEFASRVRLVGSCFAAATVTIGTSLAANADILTNYATGTHGTFFQLPTPRGTEVDGETFQVPQDSVATSADIELSVTQGTTQGITLSLYATTGSINGPQPTGVALTSVTDPASDVSSSLIEYIPFDFTTPVALTGGTEYALVLTTTAPDSSYSWYGDQQSSGAPYAGGDWIAQSESGQPFAQQTTSALGFDVMGSVPEPATIAMIALAGAASLKRRRRR